MLSACASFGAPAPRATPAPEAAPIIERVTVTRMICPAELDAPVPPRPVAPADAIIRTNPAGAAYLSDEIGYGSVVGAVLADAKAACAAQREAPPGP